MRGLEKADCACSSETALPPDFETTTPHCNMSAGVAISNYQEYPVSAPLNRHLLCLWTQSIAGSGNPYSHRVLPDGCVDIVLLNDEPPFVVGPYLEYFIARLPPGATIVGAR